MDAEKGILGLIRPLLRNSVLVVYALFALFPLIWMVILSFKPDDQMFTSVFVFTPTLENF
jgi:multiple sugar transport system permease protein